MNTAKSKAAAIAPLFAYLLTLTISVVGSSYLSGRIWGIDIWNGTPGAPGAFSLLIFGLVVGACVWFLPYFRASRNTERSSASDGAYVLLSLVLLVLFILAFYLFRARTHFLGDGYTLLSLLAADNPLIKQREVGESLIHVWVKNIFGLSGEVGALKAFQIISISAGALYLAALSIAARKLFENNIQRALFVVGIMCAGNAPLFFGYVENYSVFAVSVLLVTLIGALSLSDRVSKLWIIPALAFSIWLHALGVTLIPGVAYVLVRDTQLGRLLSSLALSWKLSLATVSLALFGSVFVYFYRTNIFFEAALLPIFQSRFTVDGYTLFSRAHLLDFANLLILLCPWALVALALFLSKQRKALVAEGHSQIVRFLVILSVSTVAAVFIFDPKIGMPRDWDLFSFTVIPAAVLFYFILLKRPHDIPFAVKIAALSIALSLLTLVPRISASLDEQIAVKRIEAYIELDKKKNRTAMQLLQNFHAERGNITAVAAIGKRYTKMYPEVALTRRAAKLGSSGQDGQGGPIDSALTLLHQALDINPMYAPAYLNLGRAFRALNNFDSALYYLEIADGLNPYNKFIIAELGQIYQELGDMYLSEGKLKRAREWFRRAVEIDSSLLAC